MDDRVLCCVTCRKHVSRISEPATGREWFAHPGDDHPVTAVLMDRADVIGMCDFCLKPHPDWAIPLLEHADTESVIFAGQQVLRISTRDTDAWWAACSRCVQCVREHRIGVLRDRAFAGWLETTGESPTEWQKDGILGTLAAFWTSTPGEPFLLSGTGVQEGGQSGSARKGM